MFSKRLFIFAAVLASWRGLGQHSFAQSNANRGLWVGEVVLNAVNEVAVPLDANNVPKAPNPNVPTKTFDTANLRLILHVDGTGHVSLLKDVAVLSRTRAELSSASDMALVTDPHLYGEFPPQAAVRVASAVFDFGDSKATDAINKIVTAASVAARDSIVAGESEAQATTEAKAAADLILAQADVAKRYDDFLTDPAKKSNVIDIADGSPATAAATMMGKAVLLRDGSFYGDTRGVEMVSAILLAVAGESTIPAKTKASLNTAASFADISDNYERFLVGQVFGNMIQAAAKATAAASAASPLKTITNFSGTDGSFPVTVTCAAHGLGTGEEIAVLGSPITAYNGLWTVTRVNNDSFLIQVPFIGGQPITGYQSHVGVAPVTISSPAHGLTSGAQVTIYDSGEATYNGGFLATVIDADTFSIPATFANNPAQKGTWSLRSGLITAYAGTTSGLAGVKITAPGHGLINGAEIIIADSGKASYNGPKTITRIDENSFSIPQAFDGNPAIKGIWSIRNPIVAYAPPAVLSTKVVSVGHGLASGDRIVISNSGKAAYNGEQTVDVLNADTFVISVDWDVATGDPAVRGNWAPVISGSWRRVAPLRTAITNSIPVNDAKTEALQIQVAAYSDSRSTDAINVVLEAIIASAAGAEIPVAAQISLTAEAAGRNALDTNVKRYAQPSSRPTADYNAFVASAAYKGSPAIASAAAVAGAKFEKENSSLSTPESILDKALQQAITALDSVYSAAARAVRSDLPLTGGFGPGKTNLQGTLVLPANHPTNPFRHRRHPDHTVGFDITRKLTLNFDGQDGDPLATAGFGVDRITGTYEEEITGLHKPLGPSQNIGLKVKGTFQLNRISLIDTLNGR